MRYLLYAALAAALTFFITLPILGVHLNQSAQGLSLTGQWQHCLYAAAVVFVAHLLLPLDGEAVGSCAYRILVCTRQTLCRFNPKSLVGVKLPVA